MAKPTKSSRAPKTISLDALANVTGGRTSATAPGSTLPSSATSSTDPNSQMLTLLNEIASSIQNMSKPHDPFMQAIEMMQAMRGGGGNPFGNGSFGGGSPFSF
jgi:hypothetical protein